MARIAIIAAMEREVRPLIRNWSVRPIEHAGRRYRLFEKGEAALLYGGIGAEAARRATEAAIHELNPIRVLSVGFAGALAGSLNPSLRVGDVLEPRTVINAADGVRTNVNFGDGVLVSSATVAGKEQKARLGRAYGASAVDMEAAAVAQGAQARGVEFAALKSISDAADFNLPALERFIANDGTFRSVRFACHVALRPWLWGATIALAFSSSKASHALCDALASYLGREAAELQKGTDESSTFELNQTDLNRVQDGVCAGAHTRTGIQSHTRATGKT